MEQDKIDKVEIISELAHERNYLKDLKLYISDMELDTFRIAGRMRKTDGYIDRPINLKMVNIIINLVDEEIKRVDNDINEMIK